MKDDSKVRKNILRSYFKLIMQMRQKDSLPFFSSNCTQYNPYIKGGMGNLFEAMSKVQEESPDYSDPSFSVKKIIAEGNFIAAYTELLHSQSKPNKGGLRQVHLFRFNKSNKITEYWDVTQSVTSEMPSAANAFE